MNSERVSSVCNRIQRDHMAAYIKGILPSEESRELQEHLSKCEDCSADYVLVQELVADLETTTEPALEKMLSSETRERILDGVFASQAFAMGDERVSHSETDTQANYAKATQAAEGTKATEDNKGTTAIEHRKWFGGFDLERLGFQWQALPGFFRGAFLAQGALLGICAVLLVTNLEFGQTDINEPNQNARYTTLTSPGESAALTRSSALQGMHVFRVIFHPKSSETDIRELMSSINGQLTSGPSLSGVYSIAVHSQTDREAVLVSLRSSPWIEFAEPVIHVGDR